MVTENLGPRNVTGFLLERHPVHAPREIENGYLPYFCYFRNYIHSNMSELSFIG